MRCCRYMKFDYAGGVVHCPLETTDRLWGKLGKAHNVNLGGTVVAPEGDPEATLLELTLA